MSDEDWSAWTSCEMYGHNFVDNHCTDCGENCEDDEEKTGD